VNPTEGRETVFGFAQSHDRSNELKAILRVETYPVEGEDKPIDVLKRWDKARRGNAAYKRSAGFQEQKLGDVSCAGMSYSWKDRNSDAEFEIWVARRDQRLYAVTIGANRRELNWSWSVDELRKSLQSFELFDPEDESVVKAASAAAESKPAASVSAGRRQLQRYPIEIALPPGAVRIKDDTELGVGIKLGCSWGRRWYSVTVLALHDDGTVRIHWDEFGGSWDGDIARDCLVIEKKLLK